MGQCGGIPSAADMRPVPLHFILFINVSSAAAICIDKNVKKKVVHVRILRAIVLSQRLWFDRTRLVRASSELRALRDARPRAPLELNETTEGWKISPPREHKKGRVALVLRKKTRRRVDREVSVAPRD